jgi:hypothetical protein
MKKIAAVTIVALMLLAFAVPVMAAITHPPTQLGIEDLPRANTAIVPTENPDRANATCEKYPYGPFGPRITGLFFTPWGDQSPDAYLKVHPSMFDVYNYFILTTKNSDQYWDFKIMPAEGQALTRDGCYLFAISKQEYTIDTVFVDEYQYLDGTIVISDRNSSESGDNNEDNNGDNSGNNSGNNGSNDNKKIVPKVPNAGF